MPSASSGTVAGAEVDRGEQPLAARPRASTRARPRRRAPCAASPVCSAGVRRAQLGQPPRQGERRRAGRRPGAPRTARSASATSGSHGSPVVKPAPARRPTAAPRDRRALGVAPVDVDDAVGRDLRVGQPELLALVDERRAAQRVQHQRDRPRARRGPRPSWSKRVATRGLSWLERNHAGHAALGGQRLEVVDRGAEGLRVPRQVAEDEVVRQVQLVARCEVGDDPVQVLQRDLADEHAVVVLVDDARGSRAGGRGSSPSPRRGAAPRRCGRAAAGPWRSCAIASSRKPSTPRSSQKRSTSCIAASTSGLSQLRSGCSGMNECRYYWPVRSSSVHARADGLERRRQSFGGPPSGARRATRTSRACGSSRLERDACEPRVAVGGVVGHPVDHDPDAARVAGGDQRVEVRERAEDRVDVAVVGDVVAEVGHRRGVERRQPDRLHAERVEVVEVRGDAGAGRRRRRRRSRRTSAGRSGRSRRAATRRARSMSPPRRHRPPPVQRAGRGGGRRLGLGLGRAAARPRPPRRSRSSERPMARNTQRERHHGGGPDQRHRHGDRGRRAAAEHGDGRPRERERHGDGHQPYMLSP